VDKGPYRHHLFRHGSSRRHKHLHRPARTIWVWSWRYPNVPASLVMPVWTTTAVRPRRPRVAIALDICTKFAGNSPLLSFPMENVYQSGKRLASGVSHK
jgi:hypothetical protein